MAVCKHALIKIHKDPHTTVFHCVHCHAEWAVRPNEKPEKKQEGKKNV